MKKVFNSFYVLMLLFLSSCASNENVDTTTKGTGELIAKINFSQAQGTRATTDEKSNAIPITSWDNVKDLQLFLYDSSNGKVAFSAIFLPSVGIPSGSDTERTFTWTNVPKGTYKLALIANINENSTDYKIRTTLDGGVNWEMLTAYNVIGKSLTTPNIYADLVTRNLPNGHTWNASGEGAVIHQGYTPPSEIFTAYSSSNVVIEEGKTTDLKKSEDKNLSLKRAISLMRVRVDNSVKPAAPDLDKVTYNASISFIAVHRLPTGLKLDDTSVLETSDVKRILIGSEGETTFNIKDPDVKNDHYSIAEDSKTPGVIIQGNYKLWQDICVLPNTNGTDQTADADAARKYFIVIAASVPNGYVYADKTVAKNDKQAVYWSGTINGVFSPNVIREVNVNLASAGYPNNPTGPDNPGGLIITVGAPMPWSSTIVSEKIDL